MYYVNENSVNDFPLIFFINIIKNRLKVTIYYEPLALAASKNDVYREMRFIIGINE